MNIKRYLFGILLLSTSVANAQNVACVGNSITYGYGLPYGTSYPNNLQSLMGADYTVSNLGVSGMTFAKAGNQSYWSQSAFSNAYNSNPNMVVIELGTNDSKFFFGNYPEQGIYNYNYGVVGVDELKQDYRSLIDTFAHLGSNPEIWTTLQPYSNNISWTITDTAIVNVINPIIFEAAVEKGVNIIDLHTLFCTPSWYLDDSVHPNESGAMELAKIVFDHITMTKPQLTLEGNKLSVDKGHGFYWYRDGELIEGVSEQTISVNESGEYKALVKVKESDNSYLVSNSVVADDKSVTSASRIQAVASRFVFTNGVLYVPRVYNNSHIQVGVYDLNGRAQGTYQVKGSLATIPLNKGENVVVIEVDGQKVQSLVIKE